MSCCICSNRAGHDEELHGDEGVEILELREQVIMLSRVAEAAENLVACWRGDISRKPTLGKLRDALKAWRRTTSDLPPVKP